MIGDLLREWRGLRGMSQMALAMEADVSPRHVSFLESGRSNPSQDMVLRLADALAMPLRDCNAMLVAAGFAPRYGDSDIDSAALAELRKAVRMILAAHEPYPALAMNGNFGIVDANAGFDGLIAMAQLGDARPDNLVDLVLRPSPMRDAIENWNEIAVYMIGRLREGIRVRGRASRLQAMLEDGLRQPGVRQALAESRYAPSPPILPVRLNVNGQKTNWITTITTFGAPQDAFVEELTIEQFHPVSN